MNGIFTVTRGPLQYIVHWISTVPATVRKTPPGLTGPYLVISIIIRRPIVVLRAATIGESAVNQVWIISIGVSLVASGLLAPIQRGALNVGRARVSTT